MNLKESIISSFFFHLILFLLMLAVSNLTTGASGDLQNIVSVDLTEETTDQPDAGTDSADEPPPVPDLPAMEEESLPEQAVNTPPEEPKELPEPEKKAEADAGPPKIEKTEKPPAEREGPASLEAYYQFVTIHKKIFAQKARVRVNELLREAFKVNTRHFYGGSAIVNLKFGPDGKLSEVHVESESPDLKAFFEEIVWDAIPPPARYSLRFTGVQIEFTVLEGYMNIRIDTL